MTTIVGREGDIERILEVALRVRACTVVGPGGIGKTTLLKAAAASLGGQVVWAEGSLTARPQEVIETLLEQLDADHDLDARCGTSLEMCEAVAVRLEAAGVQLVVIDHIDHLVEGHAPDDHLFTLLRRIVERSTDVAIVVASRRHSAQPFGAVVRLRPLGMAADEALDESPTMTLFRETFVRAGGDPVMLNEKPDDLRRLLAATGGIPLAINLVASRAATIGVSYSTAMLDSSRRPSSSTIDADPVADALETSLAELDDRCVRVFEAVGRLRCEPLVDDLASVCDVATDEAAQEIERLARRSLIEVDCDRVVMLPPVRVLAERSAVRNGRTAELGRRHGHWALDVCVGASPPSTSAVVAIEHDLIDAMTMMLTAGQLDEAVSIATVLDDSFRADLRHRRRLDVLGSVLDACRSATTDSAAPPHVIDATVEMLQLVAMAQADLLGSAAAGPLLDEACLLLDRSRAAARHAARISALRAGLSFDSGDLEAARRHADSGIEWGREAGDEIARFTSMKLLADVELESGDLRRAVELANEIVREAPAKNRWIRAYALAAVGACELERGATAVTLAAAASIAHEAAEMGDVDLIVEADWLIAMADPRQEPLDAHLIGDRIGNSTIHIQADIARAIRRLAAGDPQAAIALAADCELRANARPMLSLAIDAQLLVGAAAIELGDSDEAMRAFGQALTQARSHTYRLRVPDALDGLADVTMLSPHGAERRGALRAAARSIRSELGAVSRPRPWGRVAADDTAGAVPSGWLSDATLTAAGFDEALRPSGPVSPPRLDPLAVLSPAEIVVADLVAAGSTNREIGERLYVSRRTVESHLTHAFQKLALTSRTQLATLVLANRHDATR